jgi:hypothetical protein
MRTSPVTRRRQPTFPLLAAAAVLLSAACRDTLAPVVRDVAKAIGLPLAGVISVDSIKLNFVCGKSFRVRNFNDTTVSLKWRINPAVDSGLVIAAAREEGHEFSEAFFETSAVGTVKLLFQDSVIASRANAGTTCVATQPPASPPPGFFDDTSVSAPTANWTVPFSKRVVLVQFKENASAGQRSSALGRIQGVVTGGTRFSSTDGYYIVSVPDDGTGAGIQAALDTLKLIGSVKFSAPNLVNFSTEVYRLPNDGQGMKRGSWKLDPDKAFGNANRRSWALEAINAPFAWGCSTGGSVRIAVVDGGFGLMDDAHANVVDSTNVFTVAGDTSRHGSVVAGVLAAPGNNNSLTAGVMWQAQLHLVDPYLRDTLTHAYQLGFDSTTGKHFKQGHLIEYAKFIRSALVGGAKIINISLGSQDRRPLTAKDREEAAYLAGAISGQVDAVPGADPLFVVAAGNSGTVYSTRLGLWAGMRDDPKLANRTIVVGAMSSVKGLIAPYSSFGGVVDILAPGDSVATSAAGVIMDTLSGSSLATPLVSGVAGLVLAFDPTITATELKKIVVDGGSSKLGAANIPFLDAHGALKEAAKRTGAPLCGNRVWLDAFNQIVAQRKTNALPEAIVSPAGGAYETNFINVYHGGRRFDLAFGRQFDYSPITRTFSEAAYTYVGDSLMGGAFKSSSYATDHLDSITTHAYLTGPRESRVLKLDVRLISNQSQIFASMPTFSVALPPRDSTCIRQNPTFNSVMEFTGYEVCTEYGRVGASLEMDANLSNMIHAVAPQGDFAIVPLNVFADTVDRAGTFTPCPGSDTSAGSHPPRCNAITRWVTGSAYFRILMAKNLDKTSRSWQVLQTDPTGATERTGLYLQWLSVSEGGDQLTVQRTRFTQDYLAFGGFACSFGETSFSALPAAGKPVGTELIPPIQVDANDVCDGVFDGASTIAPLRAETSQVRQLPPRVVPKRRRP